jgi:hypothetical protein
MVEKSITWEYYHRIIEDFVKNTPYWPYPPKGAEVMPGCAGHEPKVDIRNLDTGRVVYSLAAVSPFAPLAKPLSLSLYARARVGLGRQP